MEFIRTLATPLPEDHNYQENSLQVLKEQSSNVQRKRVVIDKQQNNSSNSCNIMTQNPSKFQRETTSSNQLQQPLLSIDVSVIDQRDDLLLSTTTVEDRLLSEHPQSVCDLHDKPEDILCLVEKKKICSYCALFGLHKDHIFKSQQQLSSEIDKKTKQLQQLTAHFIKMKNSVVQKIDLKLMRQSCDYKLKEVLTDVEHEYNEIIDKLKDARTEIQNKIMQESNELIKDIEEEWQQVEIDITGCRLFEEWESCGVEVLKNFKETLTSSNVADTCTQFQQFPWGKGQNLIQSNNCKLEEFSQHCQKQIQKFVLLGNYSLKNALATSLNLEHQSLTSLNMDNPVSIQQLHNINTNQTIKLQSKPSKKGEFPFKEEKQKFRHSQFLESTLKPIRQSLQFDPRQSRNSAYGLMSKRKSQDISKNQWNSSTMLDRFKSNHRNDQTFLSPKVKAGICRSPRQTNKPNPQRIVAQFEKNVAQNSLNLSNCGLEDDSLLYLIQKALSSHIPYDINLHKNTISNNGLIKLMPYLTKVQAVNLANTGLSDSCLQIFGKIKGNNRLEEVNLLENGISLYKNKAKIENLKKLGLKIICQ